MDEDRKVGRLGCQLPAAAPGLVPRQLHQRGSRDEKGLDLVVGCQRGDPGGEKEGLARPVAPGGAGQVGKHWHVLLVTVDLLLGRVEDFMDLAGPQSQRRVVVKGRVLHGHGELEDGVGGNDTTLRRRDQAARRRAFEDAAEPCERPRSCGGRCHGENGARVVRQQPLFSLCLRRYQVEHGGAFVQPEMMQQAYLKQAPVGVVDTLRHIRALRRSGDRNSRLSPLSARFPAAPPGISGRAFSACTRRRGTACRRACPRDG